MSFLWQLLPGAREARNQVIVGYAWLLSAGLWFGVPEVTEGTELDELIDAIGPIGVGLALSIAAFLLGSFSDDLTQVVLKVRGARSLSRESSAPPVLTVRRMEEWGIRSELERLEASIDRTSAEVQLRLGLVPPTVVIAAAGFRASWPYGVLGLLTAGALAVQVVRRREALQADLDTNRDLRQSVAVALEVEPETRAFREQEERIPQRRLEMEAAREAAEAARAHEEVAELREQAAKRAGAGRRTLERRLDELERAEGSRTELDEKELEMLRKWRLAQTTGNAMSPEDAAAWTEITRQQAVDLAREVREDEDSA